MDIDAALAAGLDLESDPRLVAAARLFVAQTLAQWELDALVHDAQLVVSELVTNAVMHARTSIRVTLRSDGLRWLQIEVTDENTRLPAAAPCPEGATSGRGLGLVEALGSSWGVARENDGKTVWVELGVPTDERGPGCVDLRNSPSVDDALDRIERSRRGTGRRADAP